MPEEFARVLNEDSDTILKVSYARSRRGVGWGTAGKLTLSRPSSPPTTIQPFSEFQDNAFTGTGWGIAILIFLFR